MRDAGRVFAQKTLILRMLGEMKHLQAHVRRNSIEPANEKVEGEADQFVLRKRAPFDLCTKRKSHNVTGRISPPLVESAPQQIAAQSVHCSPGRKAWGQKTAAIPPTAFVGHRSTHAPQFQ